MQNLVGTYWAIGPAFRKNFDTATGRDNLFSLAKVL
jgi:hypothetical protein